MFASLSYTRRTFTDLKKSDLDWLNTSSPSPFGSTASSSLTGPVRAQVTLACVSQSVSVTHLLAWRTGPHAARLACVGSLKKSFCSFSVIGLWKSATYSLTPET